MKLDEAKIKYIQTWGSLATSWGINKTMAQVHALLLVSTKPLSAEDIMETLQISRGNVNMNVRALIDWGIVTKEFVVGERKEFFVAEKEMWEVVKKIVIQRKKRELEPVIKVLDEITSLFNPDDIVPISITAKPICAIGEAATFIFPLKTETI